MKACPPFPAECTFDFTGLRPSLPFFGTESQNPIQSSRAPQGGASCTGMHSCLQGGVRISATEKGAGGGAAGAQKRRTAVQESSQRGRGSRPEARGRMGLFIASCLPTVGGPHRAPLPFCPALSSPRTDQIVGSWRSELRPVSVGGSGPVSSIHSVHVRLELRMSAAHLFKWSVLNYGLYVWCLCP